MNEFKVLIVDDEEDICASLQILLTSAKEHWFVGHATDPIDALAYLEHNEVDLILTDYKMPGMNGLELLTEINTGRKHRIPAVMMTAYPDLKIAIEAINEARIMNFLTKPIDPLELIERLTELEEEIKSYGKSIMPKGT